MVQNDPENQAEGTPNDPGHQPKGTLNIKLKDAQGTQLQSFLG